MKKLNLIFIFLFGVVSFAFSQRTVSGTIADEAGEPLIGASVVAEGTTTGTITDLDGKYSLMVPEGVNKLVVSYTGFATQILELGVSNVVDIAMSEGVDLSEIVVTALGISREKKSLGYAVTELDGAEISKARETNVVNALSGKIAGVQIQGAPSTLGGSSRLTIRGANSFLGDNQPLFVIDGVPINNSNFSTDDQAAGFGEGSAPYDYGNMAQDIDPESIASMTVLKGASATALYGSRGANGVILITTKNGSQSQGIGIEVNSSAAWDVVSNLIPHQQQYGGGSTNPDTDHGFNEVTTDGTTYLYPSYSKDGSWGPKYDGQMVRHWDSWDPQASNFGELRPWQAPANDYTTFFETGLTLQNSVSLSGGTDKGSVRFGFSNTNQKGTLPNAGLQRNALTFNSNYQLHKRLKVGMAATYTKTDAENRNITGYNNGNPMQAFTQWWQTQLDTEKLKNTTLTDGTQNTWNAQGPQRDADDNLLFYDPTPTFFDNPYWVRDNFLQEDTRNRLYGNFNATLNLGEGLDLIGRAGMDFYQFAVREGIPLGSADTPEYRENDRRFQETNFELRLAYNKNFGDNLSFNGSIGGNRMRQLQQRTTIESVGGLSLDGFFNIDNSASSALVGTDKQLRGINSVFAVASLGFKNWLYLDLTARNDWSSTLGIGNQSYFYPSASLSAVLSDVLDLSTTSVLSFAKVRASWAQAGNDSEPYRTAPIVYSPQVPNQGPFPRYAIPNAQNNPSLVNELTSELEFGIDLRFFKNRLAVDAAYYNRSTTAQIFEVPSSGATGFTSRILNAGEMANSGVELMINATPVKTKNFSWDVGFNVARQYNKVVSLDEGIESILVERTWAADLRVSEGYGYMALFGQDYIRENYEVDADGVILVNEGQPVVDENGLYQFTPNREFLGNAIPDWVGGFNTSVAFKNFRLSGLFDFQKGGVIHSTSLQWSKYSGMHPETVSWNGVDDIRQTGLILPGVKADGSVNDIPILDPQGDYFQAFWRSAAPNVYEASFLKLREIRLDFTIPNSKVKVKYLRDIRVGLYGRNLAILAADLPFLDPQAITGAGNAQGLENAQVPTTRSFGINVGFKL